MSPQEPGSVDMALPLHLSVFISFAHDLALSSKRARVSWLYRSIAMEEYAENIAPKGGIFSILSHFLSGSVSAFTTIKTTFWTFSLGVPLIDSHTLPFKMTRSRM